jgi:hypothetical protein
MRFLLRTVFWLMVVILLLPSDPDAGPGAPQVTFVQAIDAVRATITDLSQFCSRNPDLCATGEAVIQVVADKARYGIEQLQLYLDQNAVGGNTLTAEDAGIPWQGVPDGAPVVADLH